MVTTAENVQQRPGFNQTEIGILPENWDIKKLRDLGISIIDGTHYTPKYVNDGIPFYSVENLTGNNFTNTKFISLEEHKALTKRCNPEKGDILLTRIGSLGYTKLINWEVDASIYVSLALLKVNSQQILTDYLYMYSKSDQFIKDVEKRALMNATPIKINMDQIGNIPIPCPPLSEQRSIATALSDVDALISSLDKLIAKKRDIKQATMQQLLTGKTRLPGFGQEQKSSYKRTEVGVVPDDWEINNIGDIVTNFRGGAPFAPDDFTRDGVKVLPKGGVVRGGKLRIAETEQQYCSQKYAEAHKNNQVNSLYTIVVLRDLVPSGPSIGLMVKIEDLDAFVLAQGVYGFKVNQDKVNPEYLIQLSNGFDYRKLMNSIMVGSTQVHITNTALKKVLIPFPSLSEQTAIATVLSDMDAEITALELKRDKTRALKQGMMQELLTGKTRLI